MPYNESKTTTSRLMRRRATTRWAAPGVAAVTMLTVSAHASPGVVDATDRSDLLASPWFWIAVLVLVILAIPLVRRVLLSSKSRID